MASRRLIAATLLAFFAALAQAQPASPSSAASAPNPPPDILVYQRGFDSKLAPDDFFTGVGRVVSSPAVGPLIIGAGIALGVPPSAMAALGASAAAAGSEASRSRMENPSKGVYTYTLAPPEGYSLCAVKIDSVSIIPGSVDRPRLMASGSRAGATITVMHQGQAFGDGRSKVKLLNTVVVVRNEVYAKYEKCKLADQPTTFIAICHGNACNRRGHVNRWYP